MSITSVTQNIKPELARFLIKVLRFKQRSDARLLINSIPKSGTNLTNEIFWRFDSVLRAPTRTLSIPRFSQRTVLKKISALGSGQYLLGHLQYDEDIARCLEENSVAHLLIIRDPRDILVSAAHYMGENDRLHEEFHRLKNLSLDDRVRLIIEGHQKLSDDSAIRNLNLVSQIENFARWMNHTDVYSVRYEDIMGSSYGGSDQKKKEILAEIVQKFDLVESDETLATLLTSISAKKSKTLRKGGSGSWKYEISSETACFVEERMKSVMDLLGYS